MSDTIPNHCSDKDIATLELMKAYPQSHAYTFQKSKLVLLGVSNNKLPYSSRHLERMHGGWNKAKAHYGLKVSRQGHQGWE